MSNSNSEYQQPLVHRACHPRKEILRDCLIIETHERASFANERGGARKEGSNSDEPAFERSQGLSDKHIDAAAAYTTVYTENNSKKQEKTTLKQIEKRRKKQKQKTKKKREGGFGW
jgi:hypothetical protein